jgi:hypothetical protein
MHSPNASCVGGTGKRITVRASPMQKLKLYQKNN